MRISYVLTWIQNGQYEYFTLKTTDLFQALDTFLSAGCEYLSDSCCCNALYRNDKLIARQATYNGVS